jgi:uncharacterized protein YndB with AHSA1/START domain
VPKAKDLKRLIRDRMKKTGESYTTARLQLLKKKDQLSLEYAKVAGMSDVSVSRRTGRTWTEWVRVLDRASAAAKTHREIAEYVSSLGTPGWWTQMVTVGYERIRGLRERGQRRDGRYEVSTSRTYGVPVERLFDAFADVRQRGRWLRVKITVRTALRPKRLRVTWDDGTVVQFGFSAKGSGKSAVSLSQTKLPDRASADEMKQAWARHFDRLGQMLQ